MRLQTTPIVVVVLTTSLPETIVQIIMPPVIINTDRYFEKSYRFFKMMMPMIMLAISEPCNEQSSLVVLVGISRWMMQYVLPHEKSCATASEY